MTHSECRFQEEMRFSKLFYVNVAFNLTAEGLGRGQAKTTGGAGRLEFQGHGGLSCLLRWRRVFRASSKGRLVSGWPQWLVCHSFMALKSNFHFEYLGEGYNERSSQARILRAQVSGTWV